jgi:proteasome lid subunit RPN8/RPN11
MSVSEAVRIPSTVFEAIVAHAREGKPEEVCGIVRGRGLTAFEAVRGRNIAAERVENYEVDPETLLLQFAFEDAGDEMMAIYHSHPVSVAYPSATDAWNAHYPDSIYLICSLEFDDAPVIRAFRMTPHWIELNLAQLRSELSFGEVRPNLHAYFQATVVAISPALAAVAVSVPAPFYIDFYTDKQGDVIDSRVVSLVEYPIEVSSGVD